jgi:hypothetical protein
MDYNKSSYKGYGCNSCDACNGYKGHNDCDKKEIQRKKPQKKCANTVVIKIENSCYDCEKEKKCR